MNFIDMSNDELKIQTIFHANWVDAVVVRHSDIQVIKSMAEHARILVMKAMTSENHPYEIVADLYALSKLRIDMLRKKNQGEGWNK